MKKIILSIILIILLGIFVTGCTNTNTDSNNNSIKTTVTILLAKNVKKVQIYQIGTTNNTLLKTINGNSGAIISSTYIFNSTLNYKVVGIFSIGSDSIAYGNFKNVNSIDLKTINSKNNIEWKIDQ